MAKKQAKKKVKFKVEEKKFKSFIEGFEEFLRERKLSDYTIYSYTSQMRSFLRYCQLNKKEEKAENLIDFVKDNKIPPRKNAAMRFLEFKGETGLAAQLKKEKAQQKAREREATLKYDEALQLIEHMVEDGETELALFCTIIFDTGCRIGAVISLRKKGVDRKYLKLTMKEKRSKWITRTITKHCLDAIESVVPLDLLDNNQYLFVKNDKGEHAKMLTFKQARNEYYQRWKKLKNISRKYLEEAVSWHYLRRGAGVKIYDETKEDIVAASEFLGHESAKTTQLYLKIQAKRAEKVIKERKWPEWT